MNKKKKPDLIFEVLSRDIEHTAQRLTMCYQNVRNQPILDLLIKDELTFLVAKIIAATVEDKGIRKWNMRQLIKF
jgi:hypothetical protein